MKVHANTAHLLCRERFLLVARIGRAGAVLHHERSAEVTR